jgi:hypothetical protein
LRKINNCLSFAQVSVIQITAATLPIHHLPSLLSVPMSLSFLSSPTTAHRASAVRVSATGMGRSGAAAPLQVHHAAPPGAAAG